ncbi:MAG: hypothetical protein LBT24_06840 [Tannerella sp.]|jgi:hypothetical protein|nr:hypothetical protein [Tannerella sp.]
MQEKNIIIELIEGRELNNTDILMFYYEAFLSGVGIVFRNGRRPVGCNNTAQRTGYDRSRAGIERDIVLKCEGN